MEEFIRKWNENNVRVNEIWRRFYVRDGPVPTIVKGEHVSPWLQLGHITLPYRYPLNGHTL